MLFKKDTTLLHLRCASSLILCVNALVSREFIQTVTATRHNIAVIRPRPLKMFSCWVLHVALILMVTNVITGLGATS